MKLRTLLLAVLVALVGPMTVRADTVYFKQPGTNGIRSVSGEIVQEHGDVVEIVTGSGESVLIAKKDVFQIIRNDGSVPVDDESEAVTSAVGRTTHVGVKGGMTVSNIAVDPQELEDENSLQSYAVGIWWNIPVNRRFAIQPEALYSVKGDSEEFGGFTASTKMGYIDVPVLAKIGFLHGNTLRPSLFVGPLLGYNVSAKTKLEGDGSTVDVDVKDMVRKFEAGVVIGGGLDFRRGEHTFGIDLRYTRGLSNVAGENANGNGRNDVFAVLGSIGFQ